MRLFWTLAAVFVLYAGLGFNSAEAQDQEQSSLYFPFDGNLNSFGGERWTAESGQPAFGTGLFDEGLMGQGITIGARNSAQLLTLLPETASLKPGSDFSVTFWVWTGAGSDQRFALLSQKEFEDNSLTSQKNPGWVFYVSHGTWAWNIGSGSRRLTTGPSSQDR